MASAHVQCRDTRLHEPDLEVTKLAVVFRVAADELAAWHFDRWSGHREHEACGWIGRQRDVGRLGSPVAKPHVDVVRFTDSYPSFGAHFLLDVLAADREVDAASASVIIQVLEAILAHAEDPALVVRHGFHLPALGTHLR